MIKNFLYVCTLVVLWSITACSPEPPAAGFTLRTADDTGIHFTNTITETPERNILTYEYMYNGGGVAAGDLNNDGWTDLIFTGNTTQNRVYLNRGHWKFEDITDATGLAGRPHWKTGVTLADINHDGRLDIYICYSGPGTDAERCNELYINRGGDVPVFSEEAATYGLDACGTYSTQAAFFDYDRDGDLDMFLLNHARLTYNPFFNSRRLRNTRHPQFGNRLYRNDDGRFHDVSADAGIHGSGVNFGLGVAVSDLNSDGWPDLYVTNDYEEQDFLYLNQHDGTFRETLQASMAHLARNGMGCDIADYNNDQRPDVVVVDMLPEDDYRQKILKGPDDYDRYHLLRDSGYHHQNMRNVLQLNLGNSPDGTPRFSEIGQLAGMSTTDWSWSPLFADYDNDGWKDLFITNGFLRDFTNLDFVKYKYQQAQRANGYDPQEAYKIVQQLPSTPLNNYIFRNNGQLAFTNQTQTWHLDEKNVSNGATYADLDNDGDLDLIVNNLNSPASLYRNDLPTRHYLRLRLQGQDLNPFAIGARVTVYAPQPQVQELYSTRGFQSAVAPELHFGLGDARQADSLVVTWPDGRQSRLTAVRADTTLVLRYADGTRPPAPEAPEPRRFFEEVTDVGAAFAHRENDFIDYKIQFLLPYKLSACGPALATGDVNGDGDDDFYVGGAAGQSGQLYLSRGMGYVPAVAQPWQADSVSEDTAALFFDADGDEDADLYVVSGGVEFPPSWAQALRDRLYLNDGRGHFTAAPDALPKEISNGSCVAAADYDHDGDLDLFVGGYALPGNFPNTSASLLLRNDTHTGRVTFTNITPEALRHPGLITAATWYDDNDDGWPELLLAGEWMPLRLFDNQRGTLISRGDTTLSHHHGLWRQLVATDIDGDGDTDIVAGNAGRNLTFHPTPETPVTLFAGDFNRDGMTDPLLGYYTNGQLVPYASRDEFLEQLPAFKPLYTSYATYASTTLPQLLQARSLQPTDTLYVHQLASGIFRREPDGYRWQPLPPEAQFSKVSGILWEDFTGDGRRDVLLAGNFHPYRVPWGQSDAAAGLLLDMPANSAGVPVMSDRSGFYANGDVRGLAMLRTRHSRRVLVARNNSTLLIYQCLIHP